MNIGVLRRQAKALGIDSIGRVSKEEIVDLILGEGLPVSSADNHSSQEPQAVVVYWEEGSYRTVYLPLKAIKGLLD
jgi:hypothetical protein